MQYGFCVVKYKCTSYFFMLKSIPWCLVVVVWQDCARQNTVNIVNGANIVNIVVIVEICGAGQVGHSDTCHPIVMTLWSLLFVAITTTTSHQHNHLPLDDNDIIPAPTPAPQQWKGQLQTESSCNCYHSIVLFPALLSHQHRAGWWQWKRWGGCLVVSGPLASTSQLGAAVTTLWLYNNSILIVMAATISSHKHSSHLNGAMPDISRHATLNFLFTEGRFTVRWK